MWNDLTMTQRAAVISQAVEAGLRDIDSIRSFYSNALGSGRMLKDGGEIDNPPTTNNRKQDEQEIKWMKDWLSSRKDILQKNAEATTFAYKKYSPINNTGDVRDAGYKMEYYANYPNPLSYIKGYTPTENQINKLIYAQVENAANTPKQNVGGGSNYSYNTRGVYVEPNPWTNKNSNYIAFAGENTPSEVKVHEFTHASNPEQQEQYIENIIFKDRDIPTITYTAKTKRDNAKELYAALQEFRYKNKLNPKQKVTKNG